MEVVVGTPGRLIDLMNQGTLKLGRIRTLVMDEADEMLDMGFLPDVEKLISQIPPRRHTMLFSATMPGPVVALARRYMYQPTHIRATDPTDSSQTVRQVKQVVYRVHSLNKTEVIARILQARNRGLTIIFTRTKRTCQRLSDELAERGFATGAIHGDLGQNARERALRAFRHGKVDVLVATDVAARGIDVDDVTHVINYECPEDDKTYIHRIGRTARAGNKGSAITFIDWEDLTRWRVINRTLDLDFADPQETYHTSPHLYSDLDIPTDATANLPRFRRVRAGLEAEELEDLGGRDPARPGKRRAGKGSGAGRRKSEKGRGPRKNTKKKHDCKEREKTTKRGAAEEPAKKERQRKRTRRHKSDKTGKGKGAH